MSSPDRSPPNPETARREKEARQCLDEADRHLAADDPKSTHDFLCRARDLVPESPLVHNALGWFLASRGDLKGGEACFRVALSLRPRSPRALANLAGILIRRGHTAEATSLLRAILDLDPLHEEARTALRRLVRSSLHASLAWSCPLHGQLPQGSWTVALPVAI